MFDEDKRFLWLPLNYNNTSIYLYFSYLCCVNSNKSYINIFFFFYLILVKKKKAPLMQKALQLIKSTRRR